MWSDCCGVMHVVSYEKDISGCVGAQNSLSGTETATSSSPPNMGGHSTHQGPTHSRGDEKKQAKVVMQTVTSLEAASMPRLWLSTFAVPASQ